MVGEMAQLLGSIAAVVAAVSSTINGRKAKRRGDLLEGKMEQVHATTNGLAIRNEEIAGKLGVQTGRQQMRDEANPPPDLTGD